MIIIHFDQFISHLSVDLIRIKIIIIIIHITSDINVLFCLFVPLSARIRTWLFTSSLYALLCVFFFFNCYYIIYDCI